MLSGSRSLGERNPFHPLWQFRALIWQLIGRDPAQRYQGAFLGTWWSLIVPLFMLLAYTFVVSTIFHAQREGQAGSSSFGQFGLVLFAGLTPFNLFAEVINRGPGLVLAVPNYVKKVVFPIEILAHGALVAGRGDERA